MKSTDVIISGGGIPGLTLGILLAKAGLDTVLCDPSLLISPDKIPLSGRTTALMEGSLSVLDKAGLLEKIETLSEDLKILSIVDQDFRVDFKCKEIGLPRFGQNVQNNLLQAHAAELYRSLKHTKLLQDKIVNFDFFESGIVAEFSNGERISAKLLVGADGRNSFVRQHSNIDIWQHDYKQIALTGLISHTKSHKNASTEFHFSGGPFTLVPMQDNKCSFVWMEKTEDAKRILTHSKFQIEDIMQARSQGLVGEITLLSPLESFPIKIQKSNTLIAKRVALIAEAAHVLSPIGAQGMNLSLRDVVSLTDVILNAAKLGLDFGAHNTLKAYEKERFLDIGLRVAGTDVLNRSVATENNFINRLKKLGLATAQNIAPLRSILVHEALAPHISFTQDILSALDTRATVNTSTRAAPAA